MKKASIFALLAVMVFVIAAMSACAPGNGDEPAAPGQEAAPGQQQAEVPEAADPAVPGEPAEDTHLQVVQPVMPTNFDPVSQAEVPASRAISLIFNTLVYVDADNNFVPGLATDWRFIDAENIVLYIREGVRFHDGSILTADDVVFSLNRAAVSPHVAIIADFIHEAVALDEHTVQLTTRFPFAPMLAHLTHTSTSIVSREVVERIGDDEHLFNPIGTGPFEFYSFIAGDRFELVRFEDFNSVKPGLPEGQLPAASRITFRIIPEPGVRTMELETGSAHILVEVAATEVARVRENPNLTMFDQPNFSLNTWLGFNTSRAPFDDERVRRAIAYVLDIETIVDVAWAGLGFVANAPLPSTIPFAVQFPVHPTNIDRARELMADAGHTDGFEMDLWLNEGNSMRADAATMIQAQLRAINIETNIFIYEWAVLLPGTAAGEHDAWLGGWVTSTGDADYGLYPLFHTDSFGEPGNRFFYSNPRVDYLIEAGRSTTGEAERREIYREVQELIMDDLPLIPLWQAVELHAAGNMIGGLEVTPAAHLRLWNVYFR